MRISGPKRPPRPRRKRSRRRNRAKDDGGRILSAVCSPSSFSSDIRGADHLVPFLSLVGNKLTECRRRTGEDIASQVDEAPCRLFVSHAGIDLLVELVDDLGGRSFWSDDPVPAVRLVARQKLAQRRNVRH